MLCLLNGWQLPEHTNEAAGSGVLVVCVAGHNQHNKIRVKGGGDGRPSLLRLFAHISCCLCLLGVCIINHDFAKKREWVCMFAEIYLSAFVVVCVCRSFLGTLVRE